MTKEEAIERIKSRYDKWALDDKDLDAIQTIIPQLAESEDERIRKWIRLCLDECVHSDIIRDYERDECISYLEKQKEKQPAEWSEEDEKIIQSLILEVNKYVFFAGIEANKIVSFLKSLRPSWKPSKEQIDALERAIVKMHTANDIGILAELRDNLKKLM